MEKQNLDEIINEVRELRKNGLDFGQIRAILSNQKFGDEAITSAFRLLDAEEIHQLVLKQKIKTVFRDFILAVLLFLVASFYQIISIERINDLNAVVLVPLLSLVVYFYIRYESTKEGRYSTFKLFRENKPNRYKKNY